MPVPLLFTFSGVLQYSGAAMAVGLFEVVPPSSVAWARVALAAGLLLPASAPWRRAWTRHDLVSAGVFGVFLATMNIAFYVAIDRIPLGNAVAIEFLGPVAVAAWTGEGWRDRAGIAFAAVGVALLAGVTLEDGWTEDASVGLGAILVAAAAWAAYIVLGRRVARGGDGFSALAAAMSIGALVFAPLFAGPAVRQLSDPTLFATAVGVALLSSVLPYVVEQTILRRVSAARFSILLALLPLTATATGALALGQSPGPSELVGVGLVVVAILVSAGR